MFGIGMPEMLLIMAIALIVIGPKKLPDLAKTLGRAFGEFRKATSELKDSVGLNGEIGGLKDVKKSFDGMNNDIKDSFYKTASDHPSAANKKSTAAENSDEPSEPPAENPDEKSPPAADPPSSDHEKSPKKDGDQ